MEPQEGLFLGTNGILCTVNIDGRKRAAHTCMRNLESTQASTYHSDYFAMIIPALDPDCDDSCGKLPSDNVSQPKSLPPRRQAMPSTKALARLLPLACSMPCPHILISKGPDMAAPLHTLVLAFRSDSLPRAFMPGSLPPSLRIRNSPQLTIPQRRFA